MTGGKFNAMSIPFTATGSDKATLEGCLNFSNAVAGWGSNDADTIQVWDPTTSMYATYYLYDDNGVPGGWWNDETQEAFESDFPQGLEPGFSFWYLAQPNSGALSMTQSGQVPDFATVPFAITKGKFNAISYPFPVGLNLDDSDQVEWGNAVAGMGSNDADTIQVWDATTSMYATYYLYDDNGTPGGWWNDETQEAFSTDFPNGLPAGNFVWYLAQPSATAQTVTFKNPVQ